MSDAEEARRFLREVFRPSPLSWVLAAGFIVLLLDRMREERSGPFLWFYAAVLVAASAIVLGSILHRRRFLRRASPEEIRRKAVENLRSRVSGATLMLVVALFIVAISVAFPAIDWLRGRPLGDWRHIAMQGLLALMFLHTYSVEVPRARRLLESLPSEKGQEPVTAN